MDAGTAWQHGLRHQANERASGSRAGASGTGSSEHDDAAAALLEANVWEADQLEPVPPSAITQPSNLATRNTSSPLHPGIFQPPPPSPLLQPNGANLPSDDHLEAALSDPDSDFEFVDSDTPTQVDGTVEGGNRGYSYIPTALREQYSARSRKANQPDQKQQEDDEDEDWDAVPGAQEIDIPPRMEGGNDFEQPEWRQAGPHADAQDLAGPGEHGMLECTVTKPQKEGEGTQNVYVSYLVTTDVGGCPV